MDTPTNSAQENIVPAPIQPSDTVTQADDIHSHEREYNRTISSSVQNVPTQECDQSGPYETSSLSEWYKALQQVLPIYIATHLAFLILTYFAALFTIDNFSTKFLRVHSLLTSWFRWDSGQYTGIATGGYTERPSPAFFPLFPLLEKGLSFLTHDPFVAGLIISNLAGLGMLIVLYRLVEQDIDPERAYRTVLYLSVFPTAFFFAAAYNETLFLFLTLLSFYYMRCANWWLAGLFGFFASLTRSVGILLLLPFCYEYLRQHHFNFRLLRLDVLAGILIPVGLGVYSLYLYFQYADPLAFSHAQSIWNRYLAPPWQPFIDAVTQISQNKILSFISIHNVLDLSAILFILILLVFSFMGPWRFAPDQWSYNIYAVSLYIVFLILPIKGIVPLSSYSRFMLEIFPAFIVLAAIGKKPQFHLYYLTVSLTLLSFLLLQFLTGHWIV